MSDFRLAVCAEMVFLELPFVERVRTIAGLGFDVEMWEWAGKNLDEVERAGATISSMTGYLGGTLADADGAEELLKTARMSLDVAERLGCPRLNVHGTGLDERGLPVVPAGEVTPAMWLTAARTLERLAELGERAGRVFTLENLNTAVDHPGTPFARAADTIALVEAVGSPFVRLNLDLYHAQIGEGDLVRLVERALPFVGEIQVADVPNRTEPGTGEIHYPAVAAALRRRGYRGVVALEAWASGDSTVALERFRSVFSGNGDQPGNGQGW
ncbi:TIM barrel protein [Actinoplanes sp. LDG1-06]|uniref:TIM barrel protein n=1 Tax=Paractinoplanes ovalisporus TaxID=2810368 RepID=A0ABS2A5M1_9ACTN|nr:TIM barrel protein [Actinoplanes ovalisporus]MBM2614541.1 TIM barrel protein [Actinoplanes ovalisporus]